MCLRRNVELTGHFVRQLGRMSLHAWNSVWCFMTYGTIIQSVDNDGRTFIIIDIIINEVALFNRETTINCIKIAAVCT